MRKGENEECVCVLHAERETEMLIIATGIVYRCWNEKKYDFLIRMC